MRQIAKWERMGNAYIALDAQGATIGLLTQVNPIKSTPSMQDVLKRRVDASRGGEQGGRGRGIG